ncbi:hypothetical protein FRC01_006944 [Tulasnella sp. 417]|nr:hypothetical protein FRC01_006944 [Tulasnella sp. 417]
MADMFNMPQGEVKEEPRQEKSDHLPVILLEEDTQTVHNLLMLLYPTSVPIGLGVQAALKLAKAYDKYLIPKDRLRLSIRALYSSRAALKANPVEFYKLAWELDMELEAKAASRFTHQVPFRELYSALPIEPLEKLLDMRARREEGLDSLVAILELRSNLCEHHGKKDEDFFRQLAALKAKVRESSNDPYPEERIAPDFFDQIPGSSEYHTDTFTGKLTELWYADPRASYKASMPSTSNLFIICK